MGEAIDGSVTVSNLAEQDVMLTVIVMAVNQIGRATTLGLSEVHVGVGRSRSYHLEPARAGPYVVHADAVAEVASTNTIYRARKQTTGALVIQAPN